MARGTKRKPLPKVRVGTGITAYNRQPAIVDAKYRERAMSGALVDGRVKVSPAIPFQQFREEIESFCRGVYEGNGLPDPFDFVHPQGSFSPQTGSVVTARGDEYWKSRSDLGFLLVAQIHCPAEDHSKLWFASRLAIELTRLDLNSSKCRSRVEKPEILVNYSTHIGAEIGRLDTTRRMKFKHEQNTQLGEKTAGGASRGGQITAENNREKYKAPFDKMDERIAKGESLAHAAREVKREFALDIASESLAKNYRRNRRTQVI